jgi:hypothetical protein
MTMITIIANKVSQTKGINRGYRGGSRRRMKDVVEKERCWLECKKQTRRWIIHRIHKNHQYRCNVYSSLFNAMLAVGVGYCRDYQRVVAERTLS